MKELDRLQDMIGMCMCVKELERMRDECYQKTCMGWSGVACI